MVILSRADLGMVQYCIVLVYGVVAFGAEVLVYGVVAFVWLRSCCFDCYCRDGV
jgi:hypothetical protein